MIQIYHANAFEIIKDFHQQNLKAVPPLLALALGKAILKSLRK
ncbi:hypothetical protein [Helicobacter pylori]|nr:hypothetical protein [Helicobacter pylori]